MAELLPIPAIGEICNDSSIVAVDSAMQVAERRRVQELLRYFQPSNMGTGPPEKPRVSSDLTLNAFAQLAALKLNCQRSFISLMDHENQYIIAECTRSMSLESADVYEGEGDALLTGATTLDLEWGVCAGTIAVFNSTDGSLNTFAPYRKAQKDYFIMNDMSKLPEYKDRPYVAGWPHMKYYVEVPIHSPSGLAIGTICGVTNEPREGVDFKAIGVLNEIASAVMDHLDLVVSRVQRKRAERMINGLGLFAEGSDDRQWWSKRRGSAIEIGVEEQMRRLTVQGQKGSVGILHSPDHEDSLSSEIVTPGAASDYFDIGTVQIPPGVGLPSVQNEIIPTVESKPDIQELVSGTEKVVTRSQPTTPDDLNPKGPLTTDINADIHTQKKPELPGVIDETLARATRLIREAVDLNCVAFFDTRVAAASLYSEDISNPSNIHIKLGDSDKIFQSPIPRNTSPQLPDTDSSVHEELFCRELSSSTAEDTTAYLSRFPENLLHILLDRFPKGGILTFDGAANYVSRSELESPAGRPSKSTEFREAAMSSEGGRSPGSLMDEMKFLSELHKLTDIFPRARKIILFPLTSSSHRIFAYAIGFTTDATRVIQREDFAYITSFSNLIMAELSRINTADADLAKSRFIGSISHELRSPLHGMLASAELLKEATNDTTSIDIINTIEACGSTLLDTLDNLLTFAKINNFTVLQQRKISTAGILSSGHGMSGNIESLESDVNLCSLVEEVMNASIAGHLFRNAPTRSLGFANVPSADDSPLTVICDINFNQDWIFDTQAGAWKRILMNLLGNSLKYTTSGVIKVALRQEAGDNSSSERHNTRVCLSVDDTGKGINADFLANHLYKPFRQENELQPGTGLGLSIVRQLVSSIGGNIKVESKDGSGTIVSVTALLDTSASFPTSTLLTSTSLGPLSKLKGLRVGLLGLDLYPNVQDTPTRILSREAQRRIALTSALASGVDAFGCHFVRIKSIDAGDIDILVSTEDDYQLLNADNLPIRKAPLILLCANPSLDYRHVAHVGGPTIYLSQPFGPQRLARALEACLPFCYEEASAESKRSSTGPPATTSLKYIASPTISNFSSSLESLPMPAHSKNFSSPPVLSLEGRPRALLVEDNAINLRLLINVTKNLNCPYATATDGRQAVDSYIAAKGAFDLIFMDIQMPVMDGLTASLKIRRFEQQVGLRRTTIIAVTGLASAEAQEQAKLSGIDTLLTKPVPMRTLRRILEEKISKT